MPNPTLTGARSPRAKRARTLLPAVAALAMLSGCATTKMVGERAAVGTRSEAPRAIAVAVELADGLWGNDDAMRAAASLHRHIEQRLDKEGILVHTGDTNRPGTAVMRVRVERAKRGNAVKRYVVGFGSGNSSLTTTTSLELAGERGPALQFTSRSNNFPRPGLIMPIGLSAASGKTKTLPLSAGLGLLAVSRGGLDADTRNAAKRIVAETKDYYGQVGWRWPGA